MTTATRPLPDVDGSSVRVSTEGTIDWTRLAEPQEDEYDSHIILQLASTTTSPGRPHPYRRHLAGDAPTVFDGNVAIRHVYDVLPEYAPVRARWPDAPTDHPNIALAAEYIRLWPAAFKQCGRLLEAIHPALDPQFSFDPKEIHGGSSSNSSEALFGTLWATIHCPVGFAQAIVHEMAHQKLRALGVSLETATSIVGNDPNDLYVSPVIKHRLRPMPAVLHAQYSFIHVTALDILVFKAERDPRRQDVLGGVLAKNLVRIEEGYETLGKHFKPIGDGWAFMAGLSDWTERTIAAGRSALGGRHVIAATSSGLDPTASQARAATSNRMPNIDTRLNTIKAAGRDVEVLLTLIAPRVVLLGNVLSHEECDALVEHCASRMSQSLVAAGAAGVVGAHENRTSHGANLRRAETELVGRIEARLEALASWPHECSEGLQVVRYHVGQEYRAHFDWMNPDLEGGRKHMRAGGQRLATFVLYLSEVEAGGGTSFPAIGLEVKPRKGAALFFLNTDSRYVGDYLTRHAGLPVVKGVKFVANKWLRQGDCALDPARDASLSAADTTATMGALT
ncbi:MAG: HEXXH motif-containing putative peptide modification protein [Vitreimonas sp.]